MTRYRTIVADPPWVFQWQGGSGGRRRNETRLPYETMAVDELRFVRVARLAADDATLLLWSTQEQLHSGSAQYIAWAWGFPTRVGEVIWRKPNFGTGAYPRIGHETCVIYKRGNGSLKEDAPRNVHSVQTWRQPRGKGNQGKTHSAKPDGFYDFVEQGFDGPYAELFSRRARFGWDYPIGDQALGGVAA